jgi:hypothetical protein
MQISNKYVLFYSLVFSALLVTSAGLVKGIVRPNESISLTRLFPRTPDANPVQFDNSVIANPLIYEAQPFPVLLIPGSNGVITALNMDTGMIEWELSLPKPAGQTIQLAATPVILKNKLVFLYQCLDRGVRVSHKIAVVDLDIGDIDSAFTPLELSAEKLESDGKALVKFNPATAYSHAALKSVVTPGSVWGNIYAAFGNAGDVQPFHGWLFEIDLDAWLTQGQNKAISNVLLTTPEADCPVNLEYGTQEMICGGGIWTPSGPQVFKNGNSYELIVPVGNGQIDLNNSDYANTLMRVKPGLQFDPGCNEQLCSNFNPSQPNEACMASCKNLFIPRLKPGDVPLRPANRECDDKTFWECLAWMDYDLGANAPVKARMPDGRSVLIQPGKEGAVYLIDADHLGTQYDRMQIAEICGTATDICKAHWMGMIVTLPALSYIDDSPVVIIPSFEPDKSHYAGLTALKIIQKDGQPKFKELWRFPNKNAIKVTQKFRSHPSLPIITKLKNSGEEVVWIVDIGIPGTLYGIQVSDGRVIAEQKLHGTGRQLTAPVIHNNKIYLVSTSAQSGKTFVEAYLIHSKNG